MNDHGVIALNNDSSSFEDLQNQVEDNIITNPDGSLSCKICGKIESRVDSKKKWMMKRHMEVHIEGMSYQCPQCMKTFRSNNVLNSHKIKYHNTSNQQFQE